MIKHVSSEGVSLDWLPSLELLDSLPVVHHGYGDDIPTFNSVCWMQYTTSVGNISFLRNTYLLSLSLCESLASHLSTLTTLPLSPKKVSLVKTKGSIPPHRDEAGRNTTFNIGLLNTNSAETFTLQTNTKTPSDFENFWAKATPTRCQDLSTYLLDTNSVHAVRGDPNCTRYLATYGFGRTYSEVLSTLRV